MEWLSSLALVLLVLLVYAQTADFDFVNYDDQEYITQNEHVLQGLSLASIQWAFAPSGYAANWHPLVWLSLMLDVELYGTWPGGFHLTAVLLHAVNSLLVYALLCRMTGERAKSFVVAAVFAVHPLHVESVAWVTERKNVLSTFFGLLSLGAYARYAERPRAAWYLAAWLSLLLSLLSKQMLVTLPCLLLVLDFWPLRRLPSSLPHDCSTAARVTTERKPVSEPRRLAAAQRAGSPTLVRLLAEKIPFAALSAAFCLIVMWAQTVGGAVSTWERLPLDRRLSNALVTCVIYLGDAFWPTRLAVFYPYPASGRGPGEVAASAGVLLAITTATILQRRRRPYLLAGWLWYLIALLPVIGIIQVGEQSRADRYMYIPLIGLSIAGIWLAAEVLSKAVRSPAVPRILTAAAVLLLTGLAWNQTRYWRNSEALFRRALEVTDDNWLAHATLGSALMDAKRFDEAERHLREALRIRPQHATAHYNLALLLSDLGDLEQANSQFREALALKPDHARARLLLCLNLKRLGRFDELSRELSELDAQHPSLASEVRSIVDGWRAP